MKIALKIALIIFLGVFTATIFSVALILILSTYFPSGVAFIVSFMIASLFATFIIWGMVFILIIRPITYFNSTIKPIISGNLRNRITMQTFDEVSQFGQTLNDMINHLAHTFQEMANSLRGEKEKERELEKSLLTIEAEKARAEAFLVSIGDAVVAIDKNEKIILFNKAAEVLMGFSEQEVIGKDYHQYLRLINEQKLSPLEDFVKLQLAGKTIEMPNHIGLLTKKGNIIPVSQSTSSIVSQTEGLLGVVVVIRDITKERQLEKMKDEFVSVASHELRTPMTAIKGLISMIFEGDYGKVDEGLKEPLNDIATSTERLIQLVNDTLDVSRIETGRMKYSLKEISIKDVVENIIALMKPVVEEKKLKLIIDLEPNLQALTDPNKAKQILNNFLGNSIKFTDHGSITIKAKSWGDHINISVIDTGLGISLDDQAKLFEKFQQIQSVQQGRPMGTGLGLYICREFARKLGGDAWIEYSNPGHGSIFTFSIAKANTKLAEDIKNQLKNEDK